MYESARCRKYMGSMLDYTIPQKFDLKIEKTGFIGDFTNTVTQKNLYSYRMKIMEQCSMLKIYYGDLDAENYIFNPVT